MIRMLKNTINRDGTMNGDFLTEEFRTKSEGVFENKEPSTAVNFISDILSEAATHGLDIFMLCGSLNKSWRDDYFKKATGESFASRLRQVLVKGGDVSIFIWNDFSDDLISPEMKTLAAEGLRGGFKGKLDISVSGTSANSEKLSHFLIAKSKDDTKWLCRVEANHTADGDHSLASEVTDNSPEVPAVICRDTKNAKLWSAQLFDFWTKLRKQVEPVTE